MQDQEEAWWWLHQGLQRQHLLLALSQPLTVLQLSSRLSWKLKPTMRTIWELSIYQLVACLNSEARRGRVYGATELGQHLRLRLAQELGVRMQEVPLASSVNWSLYGLVSFSHRRTVLLAIEGAMQPVTIQRKAAHHLRPGVMEASSLRMSANNCRDVVKLFLKAGIVEPVEVGGKAHTRFQLTDVGKELQQLLRQAGEPHAVSA